MSQSDASQHEHLDEDSYLQILDDAIEDGNIKRVDFNILLHFTITPADRPLLHGMSHYQAWVRLSEDDSIKLFSFGRERVVPDQLYVHQNLAQDEAPMGAADRNLDDEGYEDEDVVVQVSVCSSHEANIRQAPVLHRDFTRGVGRPRGSSPH